MLPFCINDIYNLLTSSWTINKSFDDQVIYASIDCITHTARKKGKCMIVNSLLAKYLHVNYMYTSIRLAFVKPLNKTFQHRLYQG